MNDEPTLRIEAKFKNARLYNAIAEQSPQLSDNQRRIGLWKHGRIKAWCDLMGFALNTVYELLNLKLSPLIKSPEGGHTLRPICVQIAAALGHDPFWLFPADLYDITWPSYLAVETTHTRFVSLKAARGAVLELPPGQEASIEQHQLSDQIRVALETLTPHEALVIRKRFGLVDG